MSLRDLVIKASFIGNASDVIKMDRAVDGLKDNASSAVSNIDNMTESSRGLGKETKTLGQTISDNWKQIGIATGVLGIGIEKLYGQTAEIGTGLRRLSNATGESVEELRALAIETSNVTFPLDEVVTLMETGRKQGIKSAQGLKEYAEFWDMVGDATGEASTQLAMSSAGLRSVGIQAGQETQALSAFGYMAQNTTTTISEFGQFLEMSGSEIRELGLDINDTASILGILEHEFGMTGRKARTEFGQAVKQAEGDLGKMLETLGVSEDAFSQYKKEVENSTGVIKANADAHSESFTMMQRLAHWVTESTLAYQPLLQALTGFVPLLLSIGPIIKGLTMLKGAWAFMGTALGVKLGIATTATTGFSTALLAMPIGWVLAGVAAVIAVGVLLYKNWDKVAKFFADAWAWIKDVVKIAVDFFQSIDLTEIGKNIIQGLINGITGMIDKVKDTVSNVASTIGNGIKNFFGISSPSKLMLEYGVDIGEGLDKGILKTEPLISNSATRMAEVAQPQPYEHWRKETAEQVTRNSTNSFSPIINIEVKGGTKETAQAFKREFEKLMYQYEKRIMLKVVV